MPAFFPTLPRRQRPRRPLFRALFIIVLGALPIQTWAAPAAEPPARLVVGAANDSFPWSFAGPSGQCEGFSVDLLDAIARVMNLTIERVVLPSPEMHARFRAGEFDLLQAYSPGPGRESFADFSAPYIGLQGAVFVRKDDARLRTFSDLNRARFLLVGRGSIGEKFLADHRLKPRSITYLSSVHEAIPAVERGDHDAVFASRLTALSLIDRDRLENLRILGDLGDRYDVQHCFAVHQGDARLLARLNEGLAILNRSGEFDAIYHKWYGHLEAPFFTREQVITYVAFALALASLATLWGFLRQRALRRRLAAQTALLTRQEALLAEAQQIAHVGHWSFDLHARHIECSPEARRILEVGPAADSVSYRRILSRIPAAERSAAHRFFRETLLRDSSGEITLSLAPPGAPGKIVHVTLRVETGAPGHARRLFGTIQDITRLITAEESLRARDQLLLALYENAPNAMGVVEPTGDSFRFVSANPGTSRLLGLDTERLAGRRLDELGLPPEVAEFWTALFRDANHSAENLRLERALPSLHRHYAVTLVPLGGATADARPQVCYLAEDVTERKQIDAEVAQGRKLRAIGELVGGIAHEFNNLLTPILLKTELLADELRAQPRLLAELRAIAHASQRGADLTRRLLAFGRRSESGDEIVQLSALIKASLDLIRTAIDRRIEVRSALPPQLPALFLNSTDLHQIVLNLLLNARDTLMEKIERQPAASWQPVIQIEASVLKKAPADLPAGTASRALGWIALIVRDNGLGMSREVQERIFEPFYTTKGIGKGTGLGLATAWHLVNRLGGKIHVASTPGEGSAFTISLPVLAPPPAAAPAGIVPADVTSHRILLVEDDDLVAQTLVTALRRLRHDVTHIAHGADAWRHLTTNTRYDLVMLDIDLPGLSGIEIARRLRTARFPGKILVASGRLTDRERRELDALHVDRILEKPFSPQTLQAALQACLA